MSPIGETLRRERLKRNLNLDQISQELKISSRFLEAIEDERFEKLPAGVFARSFVRQYANLLGLDADELTLELQPGLQPAPALENPPAASAEPIRSSAPDIRVPRVEEWETVGGRRNWSSLPAFAMVIVVMLVCSGVYAFWQRSRHTVAAHEAAPPQETASQTQTAATPAPAVPAAQTPAPPAVQPPAANAPEASAQPPAAEPAHQENSTADRPAGENPTASAAAAPKGIVSSAAAAPKGPVHVELAAAEPVWVLARADGKYLFSGTMEANQTRTLDANGVLLLRLGNAGGVTITLNGKPIGPVGPKGQVREVQLTSGGFQIVAPSKPPLPPANPL